MLSVYCNYGKLGPAGTVYKKKKKRKKKKEKFRAIVEGQRRKDHKSTISHGELTPHVSPTDCSDSNLTTIR